MSDLHFQNRIGIRRWQRRSVGMDGGGHLCRRGQGVNAKFADMLESKCKEKNKSKSSNVLAEREGRGERENACGEVGRDAGRVQFETARSARQEGGRGKSF